MAQTKKAKKNPQNYMTASEADRAIYIDLEGFTGKSPALIGVLMDDDFEQIVLDDRLTSAATAKKLRTSSLAEEIQRLQLCCAETDRVLVAYSLHELNVIREHALIDVGDIYRNGRKLATRFKTLVLPNVAVKDRGLKTFLKLIGFTIPKGLEAGQATQWLGYVTDMIQRRGSYAKLTRVAKGKWTKLLGYNEYDCRGLKALVLHATKELESYSAPKKKPKAKELKPKKAIVKLSTPSNVIASPPEQIITRKKQKAAVRAYIRYVWNSESSEASKKYVCFPYQIHHDPGDPYEGNELTEQDFARWH